MPVSLANNDEIRLLNLATKQAQATADFALALAKAGGSSSAAPWTFAEKPAVPDPRDEEFEGTAFSGWTQGGTPDATAIDPYTNAQDSKWRYSWNGTRRSHLLMQGMTSGGGGAFYFPPIYKAVTLGTNELISTRMAIDCITGISAGDSLIGFLLYTGAGVPDVNGITTDRVALYLNVSAGGQLKVRHDVVVAGVATIVNYNISGPVSNGFGSMLEPIEYLWLHKLGTTYHAWCASSSGNVIYLGSLTYAGAVDHLAIAVGNVTLHAPGAPRSAIDYIRFKATATDMP